MLKKPKNVHFGTSNVVFSKSVQTVLRFWFQKMAIIVIVAVYKYVCSWIARKAQNVGPKCQNRSDFDFSAIFPEFYHTIFFWNCARTCIIWPLTLPISMFDLESSWSPILYAQNAKVGPIFTFRQFSQNFIRQFFWNCTWTCIIWPLTLPISMYDLESS